MDLVRVATDELSRVYSEPVRERIVLHDFAIRCNWRHGMYISTSSSWSLSRLTHCNAIDAKTFLDETVGLIHAV